MARDKAANAVRITPTDDSETSYTVTINEQPKGQLGMIGSGEYLLTYGKRGSYLFDSVESAAEAIRSNAVAVRLGQAMADLEPYAVGLSAEPAEQEPAAEQAQETERPVLEWRDPSERPPVLYDDTYTGERFTYGLRYRPLSSATVPPGWIVMSDRAHADYAHGTVDYPAPLSYEQEATFELEPLFDAWTCDDCTADLEPARVAHLAQTLGVGDDRLCESCAAGRAAEAALIAEQERRRLLERPDTRHDAAGYQIGRVDGEYRAYSPQDHGVECFNSRAELFTWLRTQRATTTTEGDVPMTSAPTVDVPVETAAEPKAKRARKSKSAPKAETPAAPEQAPTQESASSGAPTAEQDAAQAESWPLVKGAPCTVKSGKWTGRSGYAACVATMSDGRPLVVVRFTDGIEGTRGECTVMQAAVTVTGPAPEQPVRMPRTRTATPRTPRAVALADVIAYVKAASAESLDALVLEIEAARAALANAPAADSGAPAQDGAESSN